MPRQKWQRFCVSLTLHHPGTTSTSRFAVLVKGSDTDLTYHIFGCGGKRSTLKSGMDRRFKLHTERSSSSSSSQSSVTDENSKSKLFFILQQIQENGIRITLRHLQRNVWRDSACLFTCICILAGSPMENIELAFGSRNSRRFNDSCPADDRRERWHLHQK